MMQVKELTKRYAAASGPVTAVDSVTFSVRRGEFVALCGPSGSGKSTLLLMAGGLLRPDAGSVT